MKKQTKPAAGKKAAKEKAPFVVQVLNGTPKIVEQSLNTPRVEEQAH